MNGLNLEFVCLCHTRPMIWNKEYMLFLFFKDFIYLFLERGE